MVSVRKPWEKRGMNLMHGLSFLLSFLVSDDLTTKAVNNLKAGLTRIRNELKYHETPSSPDDKFGNCMAVSFSQF